LLISGTSPDGRLVEIIEIKDHPYFIAVQFHPELKSRPNRPHPLFKALVKAAKLQATESTIDIRRAINT
jgi:CTP synthase